MSGCGEFQRATRRWNPTAEQLRILERVYNAGNQRPSTVQIHHITEQLRHHGSVEGINVFYWFKNRKARERRKMRTIEARQQPTSSGVAVKLANLENFTVGVGAENTEIASNNVSPRSNSWVEIYDFLLDSPRMERAEVQPIQTLQLFPLYHECMDE